MLDLVKFWILSFTALFFYLDFGLDSIWSYLARSPFLLLIIAAIYKNCKRKTSSTLLFVLRAIFVPFVMLALPVIIIGGKRSAVSRSLIYCFPGVQLAVAYLLANSVKNRQRFWEFT
ncbi:MAG: hypothetical protein WCD53_00930 [Microcoleus sp.]